MGERSRRWALVALAGLAVIGGVALRPAEGQELAVVWKSRTCGCCKEWVKHLEAHGFRVEAHDVEDMSAKKRQLGLPAAMESCHTAQIGGYLVEGHVPAGDVRRLLAEKPAVLGIAVPGMPVGSPGMEVPGQKPDPYEVIAFTPDGKTRTFARH
ncbi:MAG: DUF411 domain-containing protein [Magnetococcales bacterium]|nr:DUF411 domain-containing protein [Magnetococcales bacterium]